MSSEVESLQRASLSNPGQVSVFIERKRSRHLYMDDRSGQMTIIFTSTVNERQRISVILRHLGFSAIPLHDQLSESVRLLALNKFRIGSRSVLVATDVAARGLDIPSVDLVVNYDLPHDSKTYIRRVGKTARAGKSGVAMSFVTQYDVEIWLRIEAPLGKKLDVQKLIKEEVMVFDEQVGDAQRMAVQEMKVLHDKRGKPGSTLRRKKNCKRSRDDID